MGFRLGDCARLLAAAVALLASPAQAQDGEVLIDPLEFMVSWPDLVGREVVITKGRVVMASDTFMLLKLPGGNVTLYPPWQDREDLRHLFQHCTGFFTEESCDVAASGTVDKMLIGGGPQLKGVDFYKPVDR